MNRHIRRLGVGIMVLYLALFVQLNRIQIFQAEELQDEPINTRAIQRDFGQERGSISTSDGVVVARSVEVDHPVYDHQREYPEGELYAEVTGFFSLSFGFEGVERQYNDELAGRTVEQEFGSYRDWFIDRPTTADLTLSLRSDVQRVAREALGDRKGSVVALDPRTGAVLAMWSWPSYDPAVLASFDDAAVREARAALLADEDDPLKSRTYRETEFPGSTFKVVTAAAALDHTAVRLDSPLYPDSAGYQPPLTELSIANFGGSSCGGPLRELLRVSCNTGFAHMAAETVGPVQMVESAEAFGFNDRPPIDLPAAAASTFPTEYGESLQSVTSYYERTGRPNTPEVISPGVDVFEDTPAVARAGIGQGDVRASPLQMVLVAAAVANEGLVPAPYVVAEIRNRDAERIYEASATTWRQAMSPASAGDLREAMVEVVESGTARSMAIDGFEVGGKTGTAQLGRDVEETNAWVIGFAGPPGETPTVAVAVSVEADPAVGQQTGGRTAGPIAQAVLAQALKPPPPPPVGDIGE
ncbi:MAG: penicillin-binding protein 2 [Acidimicrobiales bacterium]|nr:penicillin-binding protein 2 [Acidimicrobiales bacterium]